MLKLRQSSVSLSVHKLKHGLTCRARFEGGDMIWAGFFMRESIIIQFFRFEISPGSCGEEASNIKISPVSQLKSLCLHERIWKALCLICQQKGYIMRNRGKYWDKKELRDTNLVITMWVSIDFSIKQWQFPVREQVNETWFLLADNSQNLWISSTIFF